MRATTPMSSASRGRRSPAAALARASAAVAVTLAVVILPPRGADHSCADDSAVGQWVAALRNLERQAPGTKLIVPLPEADLPQGFPSTLAEATAAVGKMSGGTVVRREDVTIVCVPREYGPRAHLVDSAGYSAAYYSLLRRFPEEQLQAMLRGQVVPEGAWPPSAKSVARRLFHKEAFVPSRVEMEVKSQAGLLAWLAEVHGRPPTAEEVVQMETAIDRSRRRQQAMQSLRRITAIGIRFDPAIDVSPPGKQPYAVPILLARPSATADSARRENAQGFLEPTPLSEEETYQLLDRVVDQAAAR